MSLIRKGTFIEKEKKQLQINNDESGDVVDQPALKTNDQAPAPPQPSRGFFSPQLESSLEPSSPSFYSDNISPDAHTQIKQNLQQELSLMRQAANEEIVSLRQSALDDIEQLKTTAREEAYAHAKQELITQYEDKFAELGQAIKSLMDDKKTLIRESEGELLKLSIKVAEQIIRSEISLNQGIALNIVAEAINKISDRDKVLVKVSRHDFDYVQKNKERLMALMDDLRNLMVQEDPSIEPGGCLIETDLGYVDSRVSVKLESIKSALLKQFSDNVAAGIEPEIKQLPVSHKPQPSASQSSVNVLPATPHDNVYDPFNVDDDDDDIFNFDDDDDDLFQ